MVNNISVVLIVPRVRKARKQVYKYSEQKLLTNTREITMNARERLQAVQSNLAAPEYRTLSSFLDLDSQSCQKV